MIRIIDVREFEQNSRLLAVAIEQAVARTQIAVTRVLPPLPDHIIMTQKQFRQLRKAHKVRRVTRKGWLYFTRLNAMDVEIKEIDL